MAGWFIFFIKYGKWHDRRPTIPWTYTFIIFCNGWWEVSSKISIHLIPPWGWVYSTRVSHFTFQDFCLQMIYFTTCISTKINADRVFEIIQIGGQIISESMIVVRLFRPYNNIVVKTRVLQYVEPVNTNKLAHRKQMTI